MCPVGDGALRAGLDIILYVKIHRICTVQIFFFSLELRILNKQYVGLYTVLVGMKYCICVFVFLFKVGGRRCWHKMLASFRGRIIVQN